MATTLRETLDNVEYEWSEITEEFKEDCKGIPLGELIKDESFSLLDAMSVTVITDPKIDVGTICRKLGRPIFSFEEAVKGSLLKVKDLEFIELIAIIDHTFSRFIAWLDGSALTLTLFTNMYLHRIDLIEDPSLKSFCTTILKIIDLIREIIIVKAAIYEDEDFSSGSFGFDFAGKVSESACLSSLKTCDDRYSKEMRKFKSLIAMAAFEGENEAFTHEMLLASSLLDRFKFIRNFYQIFLAFNKEKCVGIADVKKYTAAALNLLDNILNNIDGVSNYDWTPESAYKHGFDPFVNFRLFPLMFPRFPEEPSGRSTYEQFKVLIQRLELVTQVVDCNSLQSVFTFFRKFMGQPPCILSRSLLEITFLQNNVNSETSSETCGKSVFGKEPLETYITESIGNFINPPILYSKCLKKEKNSTLFQQYVNRAAIVFVNTFQALASNCSRMREKLVIVLEDFAALQLDADRLDCLFSKQLCTEEKHHHCNCISAWIVNYTIQVMQTYLLSGFYLELYSAWEYGPVLWYLSKLSSDMGLLSLNVAEHHLTMFEGTKQKPKKKIKVLQRYKTYAEASFRIYYGLYNLFKVVMHDAEVESEQPFIESEKLFNYRFGPFSHFFTPQPASYADYIRQCDHELALVRDVFYKESIDAITLGKNMLEKSLASFPEFDSACNVCKRNLVACSILKKGHKKGSKEVPKLYFKDCMDFPAIKL